MRSSDQRKDGQEHDQAQTTAPAPGRSRPQPGALAAKKQSPHIVGHAASVPRLQLSGVEGGSANVDLTGTNRHPGFGAHHSLDPNRLANDHHNQFHTTAASQLYRDDGVPIDGVVIPAHSAVYVNAGAVTELVLKAAGQPNSTPKRCIFIFNYGEKHHSGWILEAHLPKEAIAEDNHIATDIAHDRHDKERRFGKGIQISLDASPQRDGVENLFTYPSQVPPQNMAKYYYGNLSLNVPYTGGERVGVIADNIPAPLAGHPLDPYREFFPEVPHKEVSIPLYAKEADKHRPSGKHMHFVYGYVKNDAGGRIYGWINQSMLSAK